MAPGYRNQNRRQNRTGYVDHDILEGLPVRQWRRDYTTIVPPTAQESTPQNDIWAVELPHGMPKDSHLLPQHSQDLLRAARSGKIYKRPAPVEEEEADVEAVLGDKPEKKDDDPKDRGYTVKAWKPVPRHLEGPAVEYLAKRRKGLTTVTAKTVSTGPVLTKATVKRIDAAGNEYVQDVVVPQGQQVEGEVISQTTIPDPSTNPVGEGLLPSTPQKRKGPPKRKPKGPGRGRKKKQMPPTSAPQLPQVDGIAQSVEGIDGAVETDGIKAENEDSSTPANNEDTEMADGSAHDSDDDDGEEGEEGDDDEEGSVDNQSSPSKNSRPISTPPPNIPAVTDSSIDQHLDIDLEGTEATARPPLLHIDREKLEIKSGSPLKNIALTTSTLTSPLESPGTKLVNPFSEPAPKQELNSVMETAEPMSLDETMQQEASVTAPTLLPPPPPEPTLEEEIASKEVLAEEEEEEEMLLDIVENANSANIGGLEGLAPVVLEVSAPVVQETEGEQADAIHPKEPEIPTEQERVQENNPKVEHDPAPPVVEEEPEVAQPAEDEDEDFPDLLGGLEKQLNEPKAEVQDPVVEPVSEAVEKVASPEKAVEDLPPEQDKIITETVEEKAEGS